MHSQYKAPIFVLLHCVGCDADAFITHGTVSTAAYSRVLIPVEFKVLTGYCM